MPSIVLYLIKCSISLAIVWLFYQLLLRRLTFYSMNRWYLLGYALLSFLLPLIHIVLPEEEKMTGNMQMIHYIPMITGKPVVQVTHERVYTGWDILLMTLAAGALLLLVRRLISYWSLRRMQKGATLIQDTEVAIYEVNEEIIPFSFGKAIYVNPRLHSVKELEEIILHEFVHVRQRHTLDILMAELLCIVSWFNPFSWLIRNDIRQNLEFIADRQVLASGLDRKAYQYHLLKVVGESRYRLANNFNFSSLKKRIIMMNKSRSAKLHLVKFLFIVPLLGVLLVAFRDKVDISLPAVIFHPSSVSDTTHKPVTVRDIGPKSIDSVTFVAERSLRPNDTVPAGPSVTFRALKDTLAKPMYVIDEVEVSIEDEGKLNPSDILFIDVNKNESTTNLFGPGAKDGVVLIFTKGYAPKRKNEILLKNGKKVRLAVPTPPPTQPTAPMPPVTVTPKSSAQLLRPTGVSEFSYDSIKVGNSTYSGRGTSLSFSDTTSPDYKPLGSSQFLKEALIVVDGRPCNYADLILDPNRIASVNIVRDKAAAVAVYGPKAEKGLVLIETKKDVVVQGYRLVVPEGKGDNVKGNNGTMKADSISFTPSQEKH